MQIIQSPQQYDTNGELYFHRYRNGIKLLRPQQTKSTQFKPYTIAELFNLPLYFYFLDASSNVVDINDAAAIACGWNSRRHAIGATIRKVAKKSTAELFFLHDSTVIEKSCMHIYEEPCARLDGVSFTTTAIKLPWFNQHNEVIGVFGCSIYTSDTSTHSLTESLSILVEMGLLNRADNLKRNPIDEIYKLTLRQSECLRLLVRGLTAKKISEELKLSLRTIESYLEAIKIKMNCKRKSDVIEKYFYEAGM